MRSPFGLQQMDGCVFFLSRTIPDSTKATPEAVNQRHMDIEKEPEAQMKKYAQDYEAAFQLWSNRHNSPFNDAT